MKNTILFVVIALAVIGIGCGGSVTAEKPMNAAITKSPERLTEGEIAKVVQMDKYLNANSNISLRETEASLGPVNTACKAEVAYQYARHLEKAAQGPHEKQLELEARIYFFPNLTSTITNLRLGFYGAAAVKAAKAGKVSCEKDPLTGFGSENAADMLFNVVEEARQREIGIQEHYGVSPAELRKLALAKTKEWIAETGVYKHLKTPAPDADTGPADPAAMAMSDFGNEWRFTAQELGFSAEEAKRINLKE